MKNIFPALLNMQFINRPFSGCILPQNESSCETIQLQMCPACRFNFMQMNSTSFERFCTKDSFLEQRHKVTRKWLIQSQILESNKEIKIQYAYSTCIRDVHFTFVTSRECFHMTSRQAYWCTKCNGGHAGVAKQSYGS